MVASLVVLSVLPDTANADHPLSDARLWGVHPPCYNGTMEIGDMAAKCRPMHMTTQEKDRSQYGFLGSGQWHHYHFAINDFKFINREFGSKVHFQLEPCRGSIFLYVKPAMLYEGKPMMNAALLSSEIEGVHAHMADRAPKEDAMVSFIKAGREGWENGGRRLGK